MDTLNRQPRKWSLAEDHKLREQVEAQLVGGEVKDWCRIAESLPGRTNKDCRKRWHNSVAGGLKKGQWSKSEDQLLSRGVEQYGKRWTVIAGCVGSRSADQCAKRWQQSLNPDLDRSEWRDSDDKALIEGTQRLGRHWKDIQGELFPGRSKNDIKNRYTVLVRKYQNQGITLPHAPSSPSECGTPAPLQGYNDDDEYISPTPSVYDHLLPAPSHAASSANRHSWSSLDNDAYATWSSPHDYDMPSAIAGSGTHHASASMPQYAFTQPQSLGSNAPSASVPWNQTTPWMHHPSSSMHVGSLVTCTSMPNPPVYGYNTHPGHHQPVMGHNSAYTASTARSPYETMPIRQPTHMARPGTSTEQQAYGSNAALAYHDPRYPYYQS
ncbi:hypothetical protein EJ02DRAFT_434162 [Clathrospora elynae]|uniref:Uncharacterized protein n=1 Tax=Clathrospora elynae TaxID=706981 RepID=A0A6A5SNQ8_9PLEO|nr:hypothetical protein EJ02DRAFT_434162 [Clathrospora elynae]